MISILELIFYIFTSITLYFSLTNCMSAFPPFPEIGVTWMSELGGQPETAGCAATTSLRLWLISSFFRPLSPFFPPTLGWVRRARAVAREGAGEEARRRESWWEEGVTRAGVDSKEQSSEGCPPMVFKATGGGEDGG